MPASKLQLNIRLDPDLDRAIEDYRKSKDRIPSRTDAVKELLRRGLNCPPPVEPRGADAARPMGVT